MKQGVHPSYELVVFRDLSAGRSFLTRSTIPSGLPSDQPRLTWRDGQSYPVVDVEVSSVSHTYWTGRGRVLDSEGRVDRFRRRYVLSGVSTRRGSR